MRFPCYGSFENRMITSVVFLRRGEREADFKNDGIMASEIDKLVIFLIIGGRSSCMILRIDEGTGSR